MKIRKIIEGGASVSGASFDAFHPNAEKDPEYGKLMTALIRSRRKRWSRRKPKIPR